MRFENFRPFRKYLLATPLLVSILMALLYWPLVLRSFSPNVIGEYLFLMQISMFLTPFLTLGLNLTFLSTTSTADSTSKSNVELHITQMYSFVGFTFTLMSIKLGSAHLDLIGLAFGQASGILLLALLRGRSSYRAFASSSFFVQLISPVIALIVAVIISPNHFIFALNIATTCSVLIYTINLSRPRMITKLLFFALLKQSTNFVPYLIGSMILFYGNKIYLGIFFTEVDVAHFQIPAVIGGGVLVAFSTFSPVLFDSILSSRSENWVEEYSKIRRKIKNKLLFTCFITFPVTLLVFYLTPDSFPKNSIVMSSLILTMSLPVQMITDLCILPELRKANRRVLLVSFVPIIPIALACINWISGDPVIVVAIATLAGFCARLVLIDLISLQVYKTSNLNGLRRVLVQTLFSWIACLILVQKFLEFGVL